MGNYNFTPKQRWNKNQPVAVRGFGFSNEHVPQELQKYGRIAYAQKNGEMYQSRSRAPKMYVTRIKYKNGREELVMSSDLFQPNNSDLGASRSSPTRRTQGPSKTGCRVLDSKR